MYKKFYTIRCRKPKYGKIMARKRKKRYKHAKIGKNKYYFYSIKWLDILGDAGHADSKDFYNMRPAKMVSQGYVFKKDKKYLWTFASYDENEAVFSDRNCFPIGCIVSMNKIEI